MKLLPGQNISFRVAKKLDHYLPICKHISDGGLMGGEDSEIWEYARKNDFTIVTYDSDFYDLSILNGHPPKVVWIRRGNLSKDELVALLLEKKDQLISFVKDSKFAKNS